MILKPLTTINLPALPKFVAKKHFTEKNGFYWLGDNFKEHFLPKVEPATQAETIRVSELTKPSQDEPIREELGQSHEITLGQLFELLKTADKKEWFISYIADLKGNVWAVDCGWYAGHGWNVGADPLTHPYDWDAGCRVFSREFFDPQSLDSQTLELSDTLPEILPNTNRRKNE